MSSEVERAQRETMRWRILTTLNVGRPNSLGEDTLLRALQDAKYQVTQLMLRRELDYLDSRKLVEISERETMVWHAELTHYGVDLVEYAIPCHPGIARPLHQG